MRKRTLLFSSAVVATCVVAAALILLPARRIAPEHHLAEPTRLPAVARGLLKARMERHGSEMTQLMWSVVMLDFDGAARAARDVGTEAQIARPIGNDATELNTQLPARFFELQDSLKAGAHLVEASATARDGGALAGAFGQLATGCVACHQVYLEEGK